MKKDKKNLQGIIAAILFIMSLLLNIISFESIDVLQGDSRTINNAGIIRGATQRLVKQELANVKNDELINEIQNIIWELQENNMESNFLLINNVGFQQRLTDIEISLKELIGEIYRYREGADPQRLYDLSESFYEKTNDLVFYSEKYSEGKMDKISHFRPILIVSVISVIAIYLYHLYSMIHLNRKNKKINQLAYTDQLTKLPNRAYLDGIIEEYHNIDSLSTLACVYFDLNNLKVTNDLLGHDSGDKLLKDFSEIVSEASRDYGFIARNGGDEFVGVFKDCTKKNMDNFIKEVYERIETYNSSESKTKISVAYGASFSNLDANSIEELISIADRRMYNHKEKYKKVIRENSNR